MVDGDLSRWADSFPAGLIGTVLDLLVTSWLELAHPVRDELEPSITRRFRVLLRRHQKTRRLPFLIDREICVDEDDASREVGRIDVRFTHGYLADVYLGFEAKKLNVRGQDGTIDRRTSEYVAKGMMRFICGRYAFGLCEGGMLAYVMDGDRVGAAVALRKAVLRDSVKLRLAPGTALDDCEYRPGDGAVRQTRHELSERRLRIFHVLLPVVL